VHTLANRNKSFPTQGIFSAVGKLAHSMSRMSNSKLKDSFLASEKEPLWSPLKSIKNIRSLKNVCMFYEGIQFQVFIMVSNRWHQSYCATAMPINA
jgi:hypothetical protein